MKKVAVFLLAVLVSVSVAQAGYFTSSQSIGVGDTEWTKTYVMDLTTFSNQSTTLWIYGYYDTAYRINGYNHWYGLYIYDLSYGGFDSLIYLLNQDL